MGGEGSLPGDDLIPECDMIMEETEGNIKMFENNHDFDLNEGMEGQA